MAAEPRFDPDYRLPADVPAMTPSGASGGLTIPDGRVLPDGTAAIGYNNTYDLRYAKALRADNYLFGMGVFPHVELSGRLVNYPIDRTTAPFGYLTRDLSANLKLSLPQFFRQQPDIAFGVNDVAGGAANFRSTYVSVSQSFGLLRATLGMASGQTYLSGFYGGAELAVGNSGFSLLAERNGSVNLAGIRYASAPIAALGNSSIVLTSQRFFGAQTPDGGNFDRASAAVNLVIPFGANARNVKTPRVGSREVSTTPAYAYTPAQQTLAAQKEFVPAPAAARVAGPAAAPATATRSTAPRAIASPSPQQALQQLQAALEQAGLERIRVGTVGDKLVVEYENHRYNQNEVDAIGIALGLAAKLAPDSAHLISLITKKAGLALYETRVDRQSYRRFLHENDPWAVRDVMEVSLRPKADEAVQWLDSGGGRRGYSRVLIEPVLRKFVGTEFGVLDYSLAADIQAIVPLWKGAEAKASYIKNISNTENVQDGVFSYARQESGLKSVTLNQSLWITDRLLNVVSVGKYQYNFSGVQNETTLFVPGRDDQARFQYTRIRHVAQLGITNLVNMAAFYRWNYQPLDLRVEAGYSQYTGNDRGPSLSIGRWFGDIQAQAYVRRSDQATFAGVQLMFPLTPRQGMRPGFTHVEGPGKYGLGLETRLARAGDCNCIIPGVGEEIAITYNADKFLFNQGRVGKDYLISQLARMREAFLLFGSIE